MTAVAISNILLIIDDEEAVVFCLKLNTLWMMNACIHCVVSEAKVKSSGTPLEWHEA